MKPVERRVSKDNTLIVTFDDVFHGWEQWFLLTSDRHWDSVHSDRAMQKRHLDEAVARDAWIVDIGDLFDAMQGRNDKRGSKSSLRPEHQTSDYFTSLVETAVEFFGPYAKNILLMGTGNHETAIVKNHEINLTWHLARQLNAEFGADIHLGRYAGWLKIQGRQTKKRYMRGLRVYYSHGSGGSSPVTKGVIQTNRRAVYLPDADVVLSGHIHQHWQMPITRERLNDLGNVFLDTQTHVSLPSYKRVSRRDGWEVEKGFAPGPLGAVWLRLYMRDFELRTEFTWAT